MKRFFKRFDKEFLIVFCVWAVCVATDDTHSWLTYLAGAMFAAYAILRAVRYGG